MDKTLSIINGLKESGLIKEFAIGGGIATIFYVEPILTYDLDVFYITGEEERGLITLSPIYNWLKERGYKPHKEHIMIEGIPVQFIPVYNKLIQEAVKNAVIVKYKNVKTRIIRAEDLIAIMLDTFRAKDRERIIKFLDESKIDISYLTKVLQKHRLWEKFKNFRKLYYEKYKKRDRKDI